MLIEGLIIKFIFGKLAAGAVVKTGVAVAAKAWVAHDVIQAVGAISDAAVVADAADTASTAGSALAYTPDVTDLAPPVGDCGGVGTEFVAAAAPVAAPIDPGLIVDPAPGGLPEGIDVVDGSNGPPVTATLQPVGESGVYADADGRTIHGGRPTDVHGNPPHDIHGNPTGRGIHGNPPGNTWGPY